MRAAKNPDRSAVSGENHIGPSAGFGAAIPASWLENWLENKGKTHRSKDAPHLKVLVSNSGTSQFPARYPFNSNEIMSANSQQQSADFLRISAQFKLGALVTESSHPVTARLSEVSGGDIASGLGLLFKADEDVLRKYREFAESGRAGEIRDVLVRSLRSGGRMFFTGCGSTGRLSIQLVSIWRGFWQQQSGISHPVKDWEQRAFSVMAGGDFALIKSVEGFEDFTAFGRQQLVDLGVASNDVVFAITEGGETSFVIGTAWQGVEAGAKVYFVYNNPDDVLCGNVERSREVIQDPRIEKINLTTGPMSISGSTRMQATSIQLCVLLTVLEMSVMELLGRDGADQVPAGFLAGLEQVFANLSAPGFRKDLARLVAMEEGVYRAGRRNNYFADRFALDVLTDTTERSPTYCTPPFRKFDDRTAAESWAFLFTPEAETRMAWERLLKRAPRCLDWDDSLVRSLVGEEKSDRTSDTLRKISAAELFRFKIGRDGMTSRPLATGDSAVAVMAGADWAQSGGGDPFEISQLAAAASAGAQTGLLCFGGSEENLRAAMVRGGTDPVAVFVRLPEDRHLLQGVTRVTVKLVLNALSTCTMVRLGRVMGNTMIWVVASNLKLIDRATRYIERLAGLDYEAANRLLFEAVEYIEPRRLADQAYPPVVGLSVLRARDGLSFEEAEEKLTGPQRSALR